MEEVLLKRWLLDGNNKVETYFQERNNDTITTIEINKDCFKTTIEEKGKEKKVHIRYANGEEE